MTVANGWDCVNAQSWHLGGTQPPSHAGIVSWEWHAGPLTQPSMTPGGGVRGLIHPTSSQNWGLPHRMVSLSPRQGCARCCGCSAGAAIVKVPLGQLQMRQTRLCCLPRQGQQCPHLCSRPPRKIQAQGVCPPSPLGQVVAAQTLPGALQGGVGQHPAPVGGAQGRTVRLLCMVPLPGQDRARRRCPAGAPALVPQRAQCSSGQCTARGHGLCWDPGCQRRRWALLRRAATLEQTVLAGGTLALAGDEESGGFPRWENSLGRKDEARGMQTLPASGVGRWEMGC